MNWYSTAFSWGWWSAKWLIPIGIWAKLRTFERKTTKKYMYNTGKYVSGKCKPYWAWDHIVEPTIVKQFSVIFAAGHGLIKGMISDNDNIEELDNCLDIEMEEIINEAKEEIDDQ